MRLLLFFVTCTICAAQSFTLGVKGGITATDDITGNATSESKRYIAGPMVELGLPFGFGIEFDALYSREGYRTSFSNFAGTFNSRERSNSWELPLLLKYRLALPLAKPFVEAGYATREYSSGQFDSSGFLVDLSTGLRSFQQSSGTSNFDASHGFIAGGGVQAGVGRLRLSPELRYTRWTSTPINAPLSQGAAYQSTQNQVEVLVGLGWKLH